MFLATHLLPVLLSTVLPVGGDEKVPTRPTAQGGRQFVSAGRFAVDVGGEVTSLRDFGGTRIRFDRPDASAASSARVGAPTCDDVALSVPFLPEPRMAAWINDAVAGAGKVQAVRILELGANEDIRFVHELDDAVIRSIDLSSLDAMSNEALNWDVTLGARALRMDTSGGKAAAALGSKIKRINSSDFRLKIAGVDTDRLSAIDGLHVDCMPASDGAATGRAKSREHAAPRVAPIKLHVRDDNPKSWLVWLDESVKMTQASVKTGTLELLDASQKNVLVRVTLEGLAIASFGRSAASGEKVGEFEVELSCQSLKIDFQPK